MTGAPARRWRGLLVSVRSVAEAVAALAGGAEIVDVKEPLHGPLGAADAAVSAAIGATVARRVPWTIACGELADGPDDAAAIVHRCHGMLASDSLPAAAKAGPAGLDERAWRRAFARFAAILPAETAPIAVAYADWAVAGAPPPDAIIAGAGACAGLLIDTFDKQGPALLELATSETLRGWIQAAHARGLLTALAGRLTLESIPHAVALGPDVVAIRGAACVGGRSGRICRERVESARSLCGTLRRWADEPLQPSEIAS